MTTGEELARSATDPSLTTVEPTTVQLSKPELNKAELSNAELNNVESTNGDSQTKEHTDQDGPSWNRQAWAWACRGLSGSTSRQRAQHPCTTGLRDQRPT
jgi:hypothetical protein